MRLAEARLRSIRRATSLTVISPGPSVNALITASPFARVDRKFLETGSFIFSPLTRRGPED
jgi:hypothetical protein